MTDSFAMAGLTASQLNEIVVKLGGLIGALQFLNGETIVVLKDAPEATRERMPKQIPAREFLTDALLSNLKIFSDIARKRLRDSVGNLSVEQLSGMTDQEIYDRVRYKCHLVAVLKALENYGLRPKV